MVKRIAYNAKEWTAGESTALVFARFWGIVFLMEILGLQDILPTLF